MLLVRVAVGLHIRGGGLLEMNGTDEKYFPREWIPI